MAGVLKVSILTFIVFAALVAAFFIAWANQICACGQDNSPPKEVTE